MTVYVFDIEADGLDPTQIYCLSVRNEDGSYTTTDYDEMRSFFLGNDILIGHNIARWDIPQVERLLSIEIPKDTLIVDTLALSWYLDPDRPKHGLESYGEQFGVPKPIVTDWINQSIDVYIHRCEEDVKINWKLWKNQWRYLKEIYQDEDEVWRFIKYISFKMDCAREQERSGWKLDVEFTKKNLEELQGLQEEKKNELASAMPRVPVKAIRNPPAKPRKADGSLSISGKKWFTLLESKGFEQDHWEPLEVITGYEDPNPNSHIQIKDWLYSLGWKPQTIKHVRDKKTGEMKEIPQINQEHGKGICPSIVRLYDKEPHLEVLDGLFVLNHRISILKGFLDNVDDNGYVKASIQGLTNTLRFQHAVVVNLPKVEKPYGEMMRGALIASDDDHELCGSDMASLEDRLKQHFIYPYDPEYVKELNKEGYDPHLALAVIAEMLTEEQSDEYKSGDKTHKPVRDIAKNGNYA